MTFIGGAGRKQKKMQRSQTQKTKAIGKGGGGDRDERLRQHRLLHREEMPEQVRHRTDKGVRGK